MSYLSRMDARTNRDGLVQVQGASGIAKDCEEKEFQTETYGSCRRMEVSIHPMDGHSGMASPTLFLLAYKYRTCLCYTQ